MRTSLSSLLLLAVSSVDAFVSPVVTTALASSTISYSIPQLSEIDEMCLENVAELCVGEDAALASDDCDLEDHEAILNQLEAQRTHLVDHMHKIDSLMGKLRGTTAPEEEAEQPFFAHRLTQ